MVLVLLQAEFCNREMDIPVIIDGESIPQHQDIEHGPGVGQTRAQPGPRSLTRLLQMAHPRQQRQPRLDHHPHVPPPALARLLMQWVPRRTVQALVRKHHHLISKVGDQVPEGVVSGVGGIVPGDAQAILVDQLGQLGAHDPALVGAPLAPNLQVGVVEPAVAGAGADARERKAQAQGDQLPRRPLSIGMFGDVTDHASDPHAQFDDKILGSHANLRL